MRDAEWPVGQRASCAFPGKASRASGRTGQLPGTRGRGGRLRRRGIPALTNTIVHWKGRCAGGLVESFNQPESTKRTNDEHYRQCNQGEPQILSHAQPKAGGTSVSQDRRRHLYGSTPVTPLPEILGVPHADIDVIRTGAHIPGLRKTFRYGALYSTWRQVFSARSSQYSSKPLPERRSAREPG